MIGYFLLLQVAVTAANPVRRRLIDNILAELVQSDPNLNPGFDMEGFRDDQLALHNHYRALHGVPSMTRDATLTQQAQSYAEKLAAANNGLYHCNLPSCNRHGAGENLAMAWGSTTAETNATKSWYDEIWDYNFCTGGHRPGHEGKMIGHFTQVVWKTSTKLGIGYARTSDRTRVFVVARYKEHGNVGGRYLINVPKPSYILNTFQDNCLGFNGGLTEWSAPGPCSQSCGGGIQFKTRTCTNPKPSLNGRDCSGKTKEIAALEWCNIQRCSGKKSYRDQQCEARGHNPKSHNFGGQSECRLYCLQSGYTYSPAGLVDDGTHCNSDSGACVAGVCVDMPDYSPPTEPPPTGKIVGGYSGTPSSNVWKNEILAVPNGVKDVTITNNKYNDAELVTGYKSSTMMGYNWYEASWMNGWVDYQGYYTTTRTIKGVTFEYRRVSSHSTIKIAGTVQADSGYTFVLFIRGSKPADISWSYTA